MVAVRQPYEVPEEPDHVATARAAVDQLEGTLGRSLLAVPPDVLRSIAARAARAEAAAQRWEARVGDRPPLVAVADAAAVAAKAAFDASRLEREETVDACTRWMARGNLAGIAALAAAAALVSIGRSPMELPVATAVAAAPIGPLVSGWMSARGSTLAVQRERAARSRWSEALEETGLPTMGALAARRVALAAWERRREEARAARDGARPQIRAWHRLAGPGVPPAEVEEVLARVEALRRTQLRLLGALLAARVERSAMAVLAPEAEVSAPDAAPRWLDEALQRFRSGRLRVWRS